MGLFHWKTEIREQIKEGRSQKKREERERDEENNLSYLGRSCRISRDSKLNNKGRNDTKNAVCKVILRVQKVPKVVNSKRSPFSRDFENHTPVTGWIGTVEGESKVHQETARGSSKS